MLDHPLFWLLAASSAGLLVVSTAAIHHLKRYRRKHAALAREKEVVYGFVQDMGEVFTESDNAEIGQLCARCSTTPFAPPADPPAPFT